MRQATGSTWTLGGAAGSGPPVPMLARPGTALLTVDLQLADAPGACPASMRAAILRRLREFRAAGLPIVHALGGRTPSALGDVDRGFLPRPDIDLYGEWLARGLFQRLGPSEVACYKPGWGAFYRTRLEAYLRSLGVETLLIAGCGFPCGPRATLFEASERLFRTVLLEEAVSGLYALARAEVEDLGVALRRTPRFARP